MTEDNERCIKIKQDYLNTEKISAKIQTRVFFFDTSGRNFFTF